MTFLAEQIVRGAIWVYASLILFSIAGFIYWIVLTKITTPSVLGFASVALGISFTLQSILDLGVQRAVLRYTGTRSRKHVKALFLVNIVAALTGGAIASIISITITNDTVFRLLIGITTTLLIVEKPLTMLLYGLMKPKIPAIANILGHIIRIPIGILLVIKGLGSLGVYLGYASRLWITIPIILFFAIKYSTKTQWSDNSNDNMFKELFMASISQWLPGMVYNLGNWLGVIILYISASTSDVSYYYIAFVLAGIVQAIYRSFNLLLLPYLASSNDVESLRIIFRIYCLISIPIISFIIVYIDQLLLLLRQEYLASTSATRILLLDTILLMFNNIVNNYMYAKGMYVKVMLIGIIQNVAKVVLYYPLSIILAGSGVALAYLLGDSLAYVILLYYSYVKLKLSIPLENLVYPLGLTLPIVYVTRYLGIAWTIASIILLPLSYIVLIRLGFLKRSDAEVLEKALVPYRLKNMYWRIMDKIIAD